MEDSFFWSKKYNEKLDVLFCSWMATFRVGDEIRRMWNLNLQTKKIERQIQLFGIELIVRLYNKNYCAENRKWMS